MHFKLFWAIFWTFFTFLYAKPIWKLAKKSAHPMSSIWLKNSPNPLFSSQIYILCTYIYFFYDNSCPRIGNLSKCIPWRPYFSIYGLKKGIFTPFSVLSRVKKHNLPVKCSVLCINVADISRLCELVKF